jgi:hypothetical protein
MVPRACSNRSGDLMIVSDRMALLPKASISNAAPGR